MKTGFGLFFALIGTWTLAGCCGDIVPAFDEELPTDQLTLENAPTSIAEDVPEFFQRYFRNVSISMERCILFPGGRVVIRTKGLPPHRSYYYPAEHPNHAVFPGDPADAAPNEIEEQDVIIRLPFAYFPTGASITSDKINERYDEGDYPLGAAGIALDGVLFYAGFAAPGMTLSDEADTFDQYESHPDDTNKYHYHQVSRGPLEALERNGFVSFTNPGEGEIELYGIMLDGTVVMGCKELNGTNYSATTLDAQFGHAHDIVADDGTVMFTNHYHVHLCPDHPMIFEDRIFAPEVPYYGLGEVELR